MYKIKLFKTLNPKAIQSLENLIFLIWLQYLVFDQYQNLNLLDSSLFLKEVFFGSLNYLT